MQWILFQLGHARCSRHVYKPVVDHLSSGSNARTLLKAETGDLAPGEGMEEQTDVIKTESGFSE